MKDPNLREIIWKNQDGTVLKTALNVENDAIPAYDGKTPVLNPTAHVYAS